MRGHKVNRARRNESNRHSNRASLAATIAVSFEGANGVGRRFPFQEQHPPKQGLRWRQRLRAQESLRKEVVFAVSSCIRTRKDDGDRLGVARPEKCGRGRQGEVCPSSDRGKRRSP